MRTSERKDPKGSIDHKNKHSSSSSESESDSSSGSSADSAKFRKEMKKLKKKIKREERKTARSLKKKMKTEKRKLKKSKKPPVNLEKSELSVIQGEIHEEIQPVVAEKSCNIPIGESLFSFIVIILILMFYAIRQHAIHILLNTI